MAALPCNAQFVNWSRVSANFGGGFTEPVKETGNRLDRGFNLNAGIGVNIVPAFGLQAEFGYNQLGLSSTILNAVGVPGGDGRIYSVTLNPIVHLNPRGRFDAYVIGGAGFYRRTVEYTSPSVSTVTAFDPFFGVLYPANVASTTVLASQTQNKAGVNIGAGVAIRIRGDGNAKFYAESRYHYMFTSPVRTSVLPVTFGFRW